MLTFRPAQEEDLPTIIALLADDPIGATREHGTHDGLGAYAAAWKAMQAQVGNSIQVAVLDSQIVGVLQLTFIAGLSRGGMLRAQIEGVRVSGSHRGHGIGRKLFDHAIVLARDAGCGLVQLTTDKRRHDARRFYEELGFTATHEGMKLELD
jgi:GNAT superfamily N-acetyltransferase